jgi:hypothetical protein
LGNVLLNSNNVVLMCVLTDSKTESRRKSLSLSFFSKFLSAFVIYNDIECKYIAHNWGYKLTENLLVIYNIFIGSSPDDILQLFYIIMV